MHGMLPVSATLLQTDLFLSQSKETKRHVAIIM